MLFSVVSERQKELRLFWLFAILLYNFTKRRFYVFFSSKIGRAIRSRLILRA